MIVGVATPYFTTLQHSVLCGTDNRVQQLLHSQSLLTKFMSASCSFQMHSTICRRIFTLTMDAPRAHF